MTSFKCSSESSNMSQGVISLMSYFSRAFARDFNLNRISVRLIHVVHLPKGNAI